MEREADPGPMSDSRWKVDPAVAKGHKQLRADAARIRDFLRDPRAWDGQPHQLPSLLAGWFTALQGGNAEFVFQTEGREADQGSAGFLASLVVDNPEIERRSGPIDFVIRGPVRTDAAPGPVEDY
jgi:hypothetical protein